MVQTDKRHSAASERGTPEVTRWPRKRLLLVAAAFIVLVAGTAAALLIDLDTPPLDRDFPEATAATAVYGVEEGVDEYCSWRMDFAPDGAPTIVGNCGVLQLRGGEFDNVSGDLESGSFMDIAVGPDGTVWLADIDGPIRSIVDGKATSHPFTARAVEVSVDGTVWAVEYSMDLPVLLRFDGSTFVRQDTEPPEDLIAAPDGSLRMLAFVPTGYDPATQSAESWHLSIGRMDNGVYTSVRAPDGFGQPATLAPDGSLWSIGGEGRMIERNGVTDVEWALVRWDGIEATTVIIPFPEPNDVAVHPDGTVWVTSSLYGAFAYDGSEWVQFGLEEGLPDLESSFVEIGPDGSVYIGTRLGVTRISSNTT